MNILMLSNTYAPHVGGVSRSVAVCAEALRDLGHRVLVVTSQYDSATQVQEPGVVRIPAINHARDGEFSLPLPISVDLRYRVDVFHPDVIHSHHPFLLGDTALRLGAELEVPVVFTYHSQYDKYAHRLGAGAARFVSDLAVGYCNLVNAVIAPSESVAAHLRDLQVTTTIHVIPTGIEAEWLQDDATLTEDAFHQRHGIPSDAFLVGHVGRLVKEKNVQFLAESVAEFMQRVPNAWMVVAGVGKQLHQVRNVFASYGVTDRLLMLDILRRHQLRELYRALDVFALASQCETQALVVTEAMASGVPVVALNGPGVSDVVEDGKNGRLVTTASTADFAAALEWVQLASTTARKQLRGQAMLTARQFPLETTAKQLANVYQDVGGREHGVAPHEHHRWRELVHRLEKEFKIWTNVAASLSDAVAQSMSLDGKVF